jgi:hypothetical protein
MNRAPAFVSQKEVKASVAPVSPLRLGIERSAHTSPSRKACATSHPDGQPSLDIRAFTSK